MLKPIEALIRKGRIIRPSSGHTHGIVKLFNENGTISDIEVYLDHLHSFNQDFRSSDYRTTLNKSDKKDIYFFLFPTVKLYHTPNGFHPKEFVAMNVSTRKWRIRDKGLAEHRPCWTKLTSEKCVVEPDEMSLFRPFSTNLIHNHQDNIELHFGINDLGEYGSFYTFESMGLNLKPFDKIIGKADSIEMFSCPHNRNELIPAMEFDRMEDRSEWI